MDAREIYRNTIFDICEKAGLTEHINNIYEEVMQTMREEDEFKDSKFFEFISSEEHKESVKLEMAERFLELEGINTDELWGTIINSGK